MGIKNRLDLVIKELGVSGRELARQCGFSESYYPTINDGISAGKLNIILSKFPRISLDWLIMGEGPMLKKDEEKTTNSATMPEQNAKNEERIDKLIGIVESQQRTIEAMASKGAVAGAPGAARTVGEG